MLMVRTMSFVESMIVLTYIHDLIQVKHRIVAGARSSNSFFDPSGINPRPFWGRGFMLFFTYAAHQGSSSSLPTTPPPGTLQVIS